MRGRGDQRDAGSRVARLGDDGIYLVAGELAAFAGLGALRHLDLKLVSVDQVVRGHPEAAGRDLLDRTAPKIPVGVLLIALVALAAFAGVALATDAVHRDGEVLVCFAADRAEAHRAGGEALDYLSCGLDLVDRNG